MNIIRLYYKRFSNELIEYMATYYPGTLILVVGNSGSGKDSIISGSISKYPPNLKKIYHAKRYITRLPSETEDNYYISSEEFLTMVDKRKFALKWHIYGLDYGIPIEIEDWLKKGHPVLANISRTIIKKTRLKYKNVKVVFIRVPFDITVQRLKNRGRESKGKIKERIERARKLQTFPEADFTIDNSGDLDNAIHQFLDYLLNFINEKEN